MWPILRGKIVTKPNGRNLNLAQSTSMLYMGQAQKSAHLSSSFLLILVT
jgi:hypothetical protein